MDQEQQKRIEAIKWYFSGLRPTRIYRALGKTKRWFYFWLKRYNSKRKDWFRNKPVVNRVIHNKIDPRTETLVCTIRKRLADTKYAQRGALAVQWELKKLGIKSIPPIWTINRIIQRNKLVKEPEIYEKRYKRYPAVPVDQPHVLHQFDLVGPRYLGKGNKFFSYNLIDAFSNVIKIKPFKGKGDKFSTEFLVYAWHHIGIPRYLQVDNELSFKGSNRHPRTFGQVIRLCLYLGIEIIFIPEAEPWRQGTIEKFNDVYDKTFFRSQRFKSFEHLGKESRVFESFHNHNHRYSKLKGKVPWVIHSSQSKKAIAKRVDLQKRPIPFREGRVSFVRLTDEKGRIRFFTETFLVSKNLVNEYVKGTIFTRSQLLKLYYDGKVIKTHKYEINKNQKR